MDPASLASLSCRGAQLASLSPQAEYIVEHFARAGARWHPERNPQGYLPLCIAENKLMGDLLRPRLAQAAATEPPAEALGYDAMVGAESFRQQLAALLGRTFLGRTFRPEQIAVLAGAGTVLENLFYAIGDAGDGVLVPTPSYAGFWADLETRDGLHIVPVHCRSEDGFRLTTDRLESALAAADRPVKSLLFTNPDNPLGKVATAGEIEAVLAFAEAHDLHVVFDEIFALSVFGDTPFTSVATLRESLGDRIHIVWAFSKDFGASGLRCGVLVSENEALLAAVDGLAYWGCVSGHTQWLLGQLIADDAFVDRYASEMRNRLGSAYRQVTAGLDAAGIPYVGAEAGMFVLCDLRPFLAEPTWQAERALWWRLLDETNVNITPGAACRVAEPGFARLCYAAEPIDAVLTGIARLGEILR